MNSIAEYKKAQEQAKLLEDLERQHSRECAKESDKIFWKYNDLKYELDKKCQNEKKIIEEKKQDFINKNQLELKPYHQIISDTEDIYKLFEIIISNGSEINFEERFDRGTPVIIDTPVDDKYKKVWIYIIGNKKPKNCFSLMLRMKSFFQYEYSDFKIYGKTLKNLPTEEELKVWYQKNRNNLRWKWGTETKYLADILEKHVCLEAKFDKEAKELWKNKEWQRAYWLYKKEYYENHYSHGTETDEYHDICILLKTSLIDSPLLIGRLKSDMGKRELKRRLR